MNEDDLKHNIDRVRVELKSIENEIERYKARLDSLEDVRQDVLKLATALEKAWDSCQGAKAIAASFGYQLTSVTKALPVEAEPRSAGELRAPSGSDTAKPTQFDLDMAKVRAYGEKYVRR